MLVIPATLEVQIGMIPVQDQSWQKFSETPISISKSDMVVHVCKPRYVRGVHSRIAVQASLGLGEKL
jgi:hypothetical protein